MFYYFLFIYQNGNFSVKFHWVTVFSPPDRQKGNIIKESWKSFRSKSLDDINGRGNAAVS